MLHKILISIYSLQSTKPTDWAWQQFSATAGRLDSKDPVKKVWDEVPAPCYGSPRARAEEEVIFLPLSFEFFNHIL